MSIRILEDRVVNQIAAGEVVERPASVVKELVENALDAGATEIRVDLRNGGRSLIRVVDDGCGMNRADAMMCIERHATSKIRTASDLDVVQTLGFRGEALPSIASVSRFEMLTRPADDEVGTQIQIDGGRLMNVADAGCAAGTEIRVRSLFYNMPARRKFLRTRQTELAHCLEGVLRQALNRPAVRFEVRHDGREVLRATSTDDLTTRAAELLGAHGRAMIPVDHERGGFRLSGLISPVGVHRSSARGALYLYVNDRFVRDAVVRRGVAEAYRGLVPKGRYPVCLLAICLDQADVDVNVHPSKIEVRFQRPYDLVEVLRNGLRAALEAHGIRRPVPSAKAEPSEIEPEPRLPLQPASTPVVLPLSDVPAERRPGLPAHPDDDPGLPVVHPTLSPAVGSGEPPVPMGVAEPSAPELVATDRPHDAAASDLGELLPVPRFRDLHVIGQLDASYVLCEGAGELVIIDQHAAHERVTLHRLQQDRAARIGTAQHLLTPIEVELTRDRAELLGEHLDVLTELHIEAERVSPTAVSVTAIPPLLAGIDVPGLIRDLADELAEGARGGRAAELVDGLLATMACHNSVRARDSLSMWQMKSLLASLDEVDFGVCAHGRPVALRMSKAEIEHRFHRS